MKRWFFLNFSVSNGFQVVDWLIWDDGSCMQLPDWLIDCDSFVGVTCGCCRQVAAPLSSFGLIVSFFKKCLVFQDAGRHSNGRVIWTVTCCSTPVSLDLISVFVGDRVIDWCIYFFTFLVVNVDLLWGCHRYFRLYVNLFLTVFFL